MPYTSGRVTFALLNLRESRPSVGHGTSAVSVGIDSEAVCRAREGTRFLCYSFLL
jgi:hypothetical protein